MQLLLFSKQTRSKCLFCTRRETGRSRVGELLKSVARHSLVGSPPSHRAAPRSAKSKSVSSGRWIAALTASSLLLLRCTTASQVGCWAPSKSLRSHKWPSLSQSTPVLPSRSLAEPLTDRLFQLHGCRVQVWPSIESIAYLRHPLKADRRLTLHLECDCVSLQSPPSWPIQASRTKKSSSSSTRMASPTFEEASRGP